jgi:hypothetical protein
MGFSLSWVAVRGKTRAAVHSELGLAPTGAREGVAESPVVSAALPDGWTLVLADRTERFVESIRQHLDESQKSSDGEVDFLYEAPVDLAKSVTGFRHDEDVPRGENFEVLRETARRPFWRRLVGR